MHAIDGTLLGVSMVGVDREAPGVTCGAGPGLHVVGSMARRFHRLPSRLRPRRMRLFVVGNGRSGTSSLVAMFGNYRAAHEVDANRFLPLATATIRHDLAANSPRAKSELRHRSRRFNLEVDSAHFLTPFAGTLA